MRNLLLLFFVFIGCKTSESQKQSTLNKSCKELEEKIETLWRYDSIMQYHVGNDSFLNGLTLNESVYRDCLESKDTAYVTKLLGNHFRLEAEIKEDMYPHKLIYRISHLVRKSFSVATEIPS